MAWIAKETFDSYSDGDLNTLNGGSGWSGAWSKTSGTINVQGTTTYQGGKALKANASAAALYDRALTTSVSAGTMYIAMMSSDTSSLFYVILLESSTGRMYIKFDNDGNIKIFDNGVYTTLQAYSANTWYNIAFDWDDAAQNNKYRVSINNGAYSSYVTVNGASLTSITGIRLERDATAGDVYWDLIYDSYASEGGGTTATPSVISNAFTVPDVVVNISLVLTPAVITNTFGIQAPTVSTPTPDWINEDANSTITVTNEDKT